MTPLELSESDTTITDDSRVIIYDYNMFIIQAMGVGLLNVQV
jgi:hypothetical protein